MRLKNTSALCLAAVLITSATSLSRADETKKQCKAGSTCKATCKPATCDASCKPGVAAATCGTKTCVELLGKLAGVDVEVQVAKDCCCSDACKCAAKCKCSAKAKCQSACKCDSSKARVARNVWVLPFLNVKHSEIPATALKGHRTPKKGRTNVWGEVQITAKKNVCADACRKKQKACCSKAVSKQRKSGAGKKIVIFPAPFMTPPHPPVAGPCQGHVAIPHGYHDPVPFTATRPHPTFLPAPPAGPKGCPQHGTHVWQMHEKLVKIAAENARLKAANEAQQKLIAQQKEHQQQIIVANAQIMRLQNQVELISRKEEIRDQLVEVSLQAAHAEWLLEVAAESPEAFIRMVRGDKSDVCAGKKCEVNALRAENQALRAKITQLEKQVQEIIKHTARRPSNGPYPNQID